MKHCSYAECPDVTRHALIGEYDDDVATCPKCGNALVDGPAPPYRSPVEFVDLVPVGSYRDVALAHVARATLAAAQIPSFVRDEHTVSLEWTYSLALGGVRLLAPRDRAEEARWILAEDRTDALDEIPEHALPAARNELCPRCGAESVQPARITRRIKAASLLIGIPLPHARTDHFRCSACGERWKSADRAI